MDAWCLAMLEECSIPEHFAEDLMQVVGHDRPDYRWLIMGPARSGSNFHVDPNCNFAWNATVHGRKKWILYPPHVRPPLEDQVFEGTRVCVRVCVRLCVCVCACVCV